MIHSPLGRLLQKAEPSSLHQRQEGHKTYNPDHVKSHTDGRTPAPPGMHKKHP